LRVGLERTGDLGYFNWGRDAELRGWSVGKRGGLRAAGTGLLGREAERQNQGEAEKKLDHDSSLPVYVP
jgi:hypothetical protein